MRKREGDGTFHVPEGVPVSSNNSGEETFIAEGEGVVEALEEAFMVDGEDIGEALQEAVEVQ